MPSPIRNNFNSQNSTVPNGSPEKRSPEDEKINQVAIPAIEKRKLEVKDSSKSLKKSRIDDNWSRCFAELANNGTRIFPSIPEIKIFLEEDPTWERIHEKCKEACPAFALALRAHLYRHKGKLKLALKDINASINLDPNNLRFFQARSTIYISQGQYEKALLDMQEYFSRALGDVDANAYVLRAKIYMKQEKYEEALRDVQEYFRGEPSNADLNAYVLRAKIYRKLDKLEEALQDMQEYIRLDPSLTSEAFLFCAEIYREQGKHRDALKNLNTCLENDPNFVLALKLRCNINYYMKNMDECLDDINKIESLNGMEEDELVSRSNIYIQQGNDEAALKDINVWLFFDPVRKEALLARGELYLRLGEFSKALEDYRRAESTEGEALAIGGLVQRAGVYFFQQKFGEALENFALCPNNQALISKVLTQVQQTEIIFKDVGRLNPLMRDLRSFHKNHSNYCGEELVDTTLLTKIFYSLDRFSKGSVDPEGIHHYIAPTSQYEFVYKLIIALQILDKNRKFILKLNNGKDFINNVGDQFAFALSGIRSHFDINNVGDHFDQFIELVCKTHLKAKENNQLKDFFENAFNRYNDCLPAKYAHLNRYAEQFVDGLEEAPDIHLNASPLSNAHEFYRSFRDQQLKEMAQSQQVGFSQLKDTILTKAANEQHATFYSQFCTEERFKDYLVAYPAAQAIIDCIPELEDYFSA